MPRFVFKAVTMEGRMLDGEAVADTPSALAADLAGQGLMLVTHRNSEARKGSLLSSRSADARAVTAFMSELATMLRGGLPIDEALELSARDSHGALGKAISTIRADLRAGSGVADGFERQSSLLGPEIGPLARVAEATGDLEGMLAALAAQRDRNERLRRKVTDALRYPLFLLVSATAVLVFFLLNVIPQFASLLRDAPTDPGLLVKMVLGASDMLVSHETEAAAGLALVLLTSLMASRSPSARRFIGSMVSRLPGVQGTLELWRASRLLSHLGLLCGQGVPLNRVMQLLEGLVGEEARDGLRRSGDRVRRGERLHVALASEKLVPALALRMISIGESTGDLAKVATEAGAFYAKKLEERLSTFAAVIGPAAILVIAALIGGLMVTIMSALTSVNQSIL